jgi:oligopeptide transport system substrate-binding protein
MNKLGRRDFLNATASLALAAPLLGLAGCSSGGDGGKSVLRRSTSSEPRSLDPQQASGNSTALVYDMFEGLLGIDAVGNERPGIAERHEVSADGLTYTFHLRDGLKWSDGAPLTSDDVLYTYRRSVDPKAAARGGRALFRVVNFRKVISGKLPVEEIGVSAPDPRTFVIRLSQPTPYMLELVSSAALAIVPRHVVEKYGDQWTSPGKMVTCGAYALSEVVPNTYIKLVKNEHYYDAKDVKIEEVVYYGVENPATALTRFRANELDLVFNVPLNRIDELRSNYAKELRDELAIGVFYILLNNRKGPTQDIKVREALFLAVDRDRLSSSILRGEGEVATGIVPRSVPDYEQPRLPFQDLDKAQRKARAVSLLREAGYSESNPLRITYKFGGVEINRLIAVALKSMWDEVGLISATLENVGASGVVRDAGTGNFEAMRYTYYAPYADPVAMLRLLTAENSMNVSGYSNAAFDEALDDADKMMDLPARSKRLTEIEAMVMKDFPVIPIYYNKRYYLVSQRVSGFESNPNGKHPSRYMSFTA